MAQAPSFTPRSRNARVGPMRLPAAGRTGATPEWPLDGEAPAVWAELWRTPQAMAWDGLGWTRVVARYALVLAAAEALDRVALAEARQLEDRLGLTPRAMRLLLWTVEPDDAPAGELVAVADERWRNAGAG